MSIESDQAELFRESSVSTNSVAASAPKALVGISWRSPCSVKMTTTVSPETRSVLNTEETSSHRNSFRSGEPIHSRSPVEVRVMKNVSVIARLTRKTDAVSEMMESASQTEANDSTKSHSMIDETSRLSAASPVTMSRRRSGGRSRTLNTWLS